ncbi:MAG: AAA family ATPase [Caldilineaceae bacterium]|nr:AAA family ATPase [Caldilineaceae bacterium]
MPQNDTVMHTLKQKSPLIVELVGLAGAGKTTLLRALSQRHEEFRVETDLEIRNRGHLPIFAGHVPFFLSLLRHSHRASGRFNWDEMKAMVYLETWPHILQSQIARSERMQNSTAILLNHGPIFKLATLNAFGPQRIKSQAFDQWWQAVLEQWASTLDIVVWLNAPDEILIERINARDQRHAVKGRSEAEAQKFLTRYQKSYEQILAKLTAYGGPMPLPFDSSQASVEQIVDEVLRACHYRSSLLQAKYQEELTKQ